MDLTLNLTREHVSAVVVENARVLHGQVVTADEKSVEAFIKKVTKRIIGSIQYFNPNNATLNVYCDLVYPTPAEPVSVQEAARATFKSYSGIMVGIQSGTVAQGVNAVQLYDKPSAESLNGITMLMMNGDRVTIVTENGLSL